MSYILVIGFVLGIRHAFDPDHLAAATTLILGRPTRRDSLRIGVAWGVGHALMLLAATAIALVGSSGVDPRYASLFEFFAGAMLILLGLDVVRRVVASRLHADEHRQGPSVFRYRFQYHDAHVAHGMDSRAHAHRQLTVGRACLVGIMHGLAGSTALILLSVAATPSFSLAILYVVVFGAGTLAGMALLSTALAIPFRYCAAAHPQHLQLAHAVAGCVSVSVGAWLVLEPLLRAGPMGAT